MTIGANDIGTIARKSNPISAYLNEAGYWLHVCCFLAMNHTKAYHNQRRGDAGAVTYHSQLERIPRWGVSVIPYQVWETHKLPLEERIATNLGTNGPSYFRIRLSRREVPFYEDFLPREGTTYNGMFVFQEALKADKTELSLFIQVCSHQKVIVKGSQVRNNELAPQVRNNGLGSQVRINGLTVFQGELSNTHIRIPRQTFRAPDGLRVDVWADDKDSYAEYAPFVRESPAKRQRRALTPPA